MGFCNNGTRWFPSKIYLYQIIVFAMLILLRDARRDERGQKPEEIYVIEDKPRTDHRRIIEERRVVIPEDRRFTSEMRNATQ